MLLYSASFSECVFTSLLDTRYDHAPADVWALGIILCAMISNCRPWDFADDSEDFHFPQFRANPRSLMKFLPGISVPACKLLMKVFELDPQSRITLPELKARVQGKKTFFRASGDGDLSPRPRRGLIDVGMDKHRVAEMFATPEEPKWKLKLEGWFNRFGQ